MSDTEQWTYYSAGPLDQFPVRLGRTVQIAPFEIAVFRTTDGQLYALENRSPGPRGGTIVEGILSGETLFDPICDWKIGLADGLVQAPDTGQVRTFPVQVRDGEVHIGVPNAGEANP